jgi:hypothetical protein
VSEREREVHGITVAQNTIVILTKLKKAADEICQAGLGVGLFVYSKEIWSYE